VKRTLLFQSQPVDGFRGTTLQNKCDLQNFGGNEVYWVPEKLCEIWSNVAGRQVYSGLPLTDKQYIRQMCGAINRKAASYVQQLKAIPIQAWTEP